jgi:TPR repeat protein
MTPNRLTAIVFRCSISAVLPFCVFAPNAKAQSAATAVNGVYNGTYTCAIGPRTLKLSLLASGDGSLTGVFTFYLPPDSHTQAFSYSMSGTFDAVSGKFKLNPLKWETPPPGGYSMVGIDGAFDPGTGQVAGKITNGSCGAFQATRDQAESANTAGAVAPQKAAGAVQPPPKTPAAPPARQLPNAAATRTSAPGSSVSVPQNSATPAVNPTPPARPSPTAPASKATAAAQNKTACELLTRADVESVLGVPLPYGYSGNGSCTFTNAPPDRPIPKQLYFSVSVAYSPAPNPAAVEEYRKQIDEGSYDDPTDVSGLGDAALWIGQPQYASLTVFRGGTMMLTLTSGPLEQVKALALKALGGPGKTGYVYGTPRTPLAKPALSKPGAKPGQVDQLKHDLTAKAEAGDARVQMALADLYESGELGADGSPKPDYAGAAYWYQQASDQGEARAAYQLAFLYHEGRAGPANPSASFELYRKAAQAGYVPAMVPLSYIYGEAKTPVSGHRATYWAMRAANAGDPNGWLIVGYEYNKGMLGGERPFWYRQAMDAYTKAADGGNCLAMMNIGGLYFNGDGVAQNKNLAQSWFAKAEACQGKDLDWMREKSAMYREKAAAGHLPAVTASIGPPNAGAGLSGAQKLFAGFAALVAVAIAVDMENPSSKAGSDLNPDPKPFQQTVDFFNDVNQRNTQMSDNHRIACMASGGKPSFGCY